MTMNKLRDYIVIIWLKSVILVRLCHGIFLLCNKMFCGSKRLKKTQTVGLKKRIEHCVCTQESQAAAITALGGTMRPSCSLDANLS